MVSFMIALGIGIALIVLAAAGIDPARPFGVLLILAAFYFLPTFVARDREARNKNAVFVINFFLGWLLIPWVIALAMAAAGETQQDREEVLEAMRGRRS